MKDKLNSKSKTFKVNCFRCGKKIEIEEANTKNFKKEKYFCSTKCSHGRKWSDEQKEKIGKKVKESSKFKKAIKKQKKHNFEKKINKKCPICKKIFLVNPSENDRIYCSKQCYKNDSKLEFRKKVSGGIRPGAGRGKSGWYKGYWCDSSYELAWVIYNLEHKIKFKRNKQGFDYELNGETHKFYPDFIKNKEYFEIKGYKRNNDEAKWSSFPYKLNVLFKKDIKKELKYVINNYGSDYIRLYEGNPHNKRKNKCKICGKPAINVYCSRKCAGEGNNIHSGRKLLIEKVKNPNKTKGKKCSCGKIISNYSKRCIECQQKSRRKIERPSYEELKNELKYITQKSLAKKIGIARSTLQDWLKQYKKELNK